MEFHDACNDAYYTARIGAEMVRLLGRLPTAAELKRREQELYHERRAKAAQAALDELDRIFDEADALLERDCGSFVTEGECLKSRTARVFRCPKCDNLLCNGNWYQLGHSYVARPAVWSMAVFTPFCASGRKASTGMGSTGCSLMRSCPRRYSACASWAEKLLRSASCRASASVTVSAPKPSPSSRSRTERLKQRVERPAVFLLMCRNCTAKDAARGGQTVLFPVYDNGPFRKIPVQIRSAK